MASGFRRGLYVHAVELDNGPVYFCNEKVLSHPTTRDVVKRHREESDTFQREFPANFKFAFTVYNPGDTAQSDVKNVMDYRRLEEGLVSRKPAGSEVIRSFSFFPDSNFSHFDIGVCLTVNDELESIENARKVVHSVCLECGQVRYAEYSIRDGGVYQDLVNVGSGMVEDSSLLVRVEPPLFHPVFAHPNHHAVFHNVAKFQKVLCEMKVKSAVWVVNCSKLIQVCLHYVGLFFVLNLNFDGVEDLLDVASQHSIPLGIGKSLSPPRAVNPVIVVEGMDGTGKSTLVEGLSTSLKATRIYSLPSCLKSLRSKFDDCPELIRRAFYVLGNYIAAQEIAEASRSGPVIVDRFWHSSAAYAIATEAGCGDASTIPPEGHDIYKWPQDLLKPDVVILLNVNPEERHRRLLARGRELTDEEKELDENRFFQERLLQSYKRMCDPCLHIIDANGSYEDVLEKAKRLIKEKLPDSDSEVDKCKTDSHL